MYAAGVRQGCTLSPWFSNLLIDNVMRDRRQEEVCELGKTVYW